MLLHHLFPEGKPKVFFSFSVVVVFIRLYILVDILAAVLLGFPVVRAHYGGNSFWAAKFQQDRLARSGVRRHSGIDKTIRENAAPG